jgi:hypothetical protein
MVWNLISTRCSAPMTTTPVPSTATASRCAIDTLPASDPLQWDVVSALSPSLPGAEGFASLMETTKPVYHGTVQNSTTCPYVHGGIADGPCLNLCRTFRKVLLCESISTISSRMEWSGTRRTSTWLTCRVCGSLVVCQRKQAGALSHARGETLLVLSVQTFTPRKRRTG